MVLPSSGQLSMGQIRTELGLSVANFSLDIAEDGGYVAINTASPSRPSSANPVTISEWWGYNHTFVADWGANFSGQSSYPARVIGMGISQANNRIAILYRDAQYGVLSNQGDSAYVITVNSNGGLELVNRLEITNHVVNEQLLSSLGTNALPISWNHGTNCNWIPSTTEIYGHLKVYNPSIGRYFTARFNTSTQFGISWVDTFSFVGTAYATEPTGIYTDGSTIFQCGITNYLNYYQSFVLWPNNQYPGSGNAAMYAFGNNANPYYVTGLGTYGFATLWVTAYAYNTWPVITNFFFGNGQPTFAKYISSHPYWIPVTTRQYGADIYVAFKYNLWHTYTTGFGGVAQTFILAKFTAINGATCVWARSIAPPDYYISSGNAASTANIGIQADSDGVHVSAYVPNSSQLGRIDMYSFDHNGNTLTTRRLVSLAGTYYTGIPWQYGGPLAVKDPASSNVWYMAHDSSTGFTGPTPSNNTGIVHKHRTTVTGNFGSYIYGSVSPNIVGVAMTLSDGFSPVITNLGGGNVPASGNLGYTTPPINFTKIYG